MREEKIRVLYLDDEEHNLTSFKAAFRREFKIFTTTTAQEAVQILTDNDIEVVISDQKMPHISGVEFFELIIPDFPDPIRMLLTGYSDIEAVIDAINKGRVFRYIGKPWNEQELGITIKNAHEVYRNRIEIKNKNSELQKAYNELEKFVYSASHDLRAPLVSILGVIKLARAEQVDGQQMEYFGMIEKSVGKLDSFVQNIINYYQNLKQGNINTEIKFNYLIDEVLENYKFYEGAEKIKFIQSVNQDAIFKSDELRVKMVLNNLVSNAIKYYDKQKDEPYFNLSVVVDDEKAIIEISDNGIGIDRENLPKIFDMFFRTETEVHGTGIGLYIVKEALDKLNGKIDVYSEPREGAKFIVEIPNFK